MPLNGPYSFDDPYSRIGDSGTPSSGGFLNSLTTVSAFAGPVGQVGGQIAAAIGQIAQMIGQGRKEADIIVPVQNQFGQLLATVTTQAQAAAITIPRLQALYKVVADGYAQFDEFTRDPRFRDGRASVQARNTIRPLVDGRDDSGAVVRADGGTLGNLARMIYDRGGTVVYPGANGNTQFAGGGLANDNGSGTGILVVGGVIGAALLK